jgi:hypothetical protein
MSFIGRQTSLGWSTFVGWIADAARHSEAVVVPTNLRERLFGP